MSNLPWIKINGRFNMEFIQYFTNWYFYARELLAILAARNCFYTVQIQIYTVTLPSGRMSLLCASILGREIQIWIQSASLGESVTTQS